MYVQFIDIYDLDVFKENYTLVCNRQAATHDKRIKSVPGTGL